MVSCAYQAKLACELISFIANIYLSTTPCTYVNIAKTRPDSKRFLAHEGKRLEPDERFKFFIVLRNAEIGMWALGGELYPGAFSQRRDN